MSIEVAWLGHATADLRVGGARFLTDPVLRDRIAHLRRLTPGVALAPGSIDAVLISHLHHDHLDLASLRRLPAGTLLVVPRGAGTVVGRAAPGEVVEVEPGDEIEVAGAKVQAVPADHREGRAFRRAKAAPLGYVVSADGATLYFPGDTDLFPGMSDLPAPDLALLPIWGWGPDLGPGHLDPERAARAAALLRAGAVLPVHWGTFAPVGLRRGAPAWLHRPGGEFKEALERHAPDVELHLVQPGGLVAVGR